MFRYNMRHLLTANVKLDATYDATAAVNAELSREKTDGGGAGPVGCGRTTRS